MRGRSDRLIAILMLSPSVILLAIFVYWFIASTAMTSLTDLTATDQLAGREGNYIGLKNYNDFLSLPTASDQRFRIGLVNTIFFTGLFIACCLSVGLLLAMLLDQKVKYEGVFRTIFLFPMALSFVVTGVIWRWLFNQNSGLNQLPTMIGLPPGRFNWFISQERWLEFNWQDLPEILLILLAAVLLAVQVWNLIKRRTRTSMILAAVILAISAFILTGGAARLNQLSEPETHGFNVALISIVIAAVWQMSGYTMAMYLAGLRGISEELREAARVDGCTELGVYRRIVFPLLAPITLSAIIILGHISLKLFDLIYVMGGGDNRFIDLPGMFMYYETYRAFLPARGAAVAMIMLCVVALVIIPYLWSNLKTEGRR